MSIEKNSVAPLLSSPCYVQSSLAQGYAKNSDIPQEQSFSNEKSNLFCGSWAVMKSCEDGHVLVAQSIDCRKEWCDNPGCRRRTHQTRINSWEKKAKKIKVMGYLEISFHPYDRPRTRGAWRKIRRQIIRGLKLRGFDRGLSGWHWFGTPKKGESPVFHPHPNFLIDSGYIGKGELASIKKMILEVTGLKKVYVYYHYSTKEWKKKHWIRYVTRATFLDRNWDGAMADELEGFREWDEEKGDFKRRSQFKNFISWGNWDDEDYLPQDLDSLNGKAKAFFEGSGSEIKLGYVAKIEKGICPECGKKLKAVGIRKIDDLALLGFERIRSNLWQMNPRSKEVLDYDFFKKADKVCREGNGGRSPPC